MSSIKRLIAGVALTAAMAAAFGVSSSPGRTQAKPGCYGHGSQCPWTRTLARKAGKPQQEYLLLRGARYLAIPGVRGHGGSTGM